MDWRAIGIGVAVGIGGALVLNVLFGLFPLDAEKHPMWAILAISYGTGALLDIAVGATSGWLAARRGALHGLLAGLIVSLITPFMGFAIMWVRERGNVPIDLLSYLLAVGGSALFGIALATGAGSRPVPARSRG
jgi:hypothetical protein